MVADVGPESAPLSWHAEHHKRQAVEIDDAEPCPEYTLVSDQVVFVIVGRMSNSLIPLAQTIDFRFHKNELAVRVENHEADVRVR
jgi:hypothetical protein